MTTSPHPRTESFCATRLGRIHYVEQGEGPPLLLLHSNGCSLHEFLPVMDGLAARHRCIAWDMPGHGDSDATVGHLAMSDYAGALVELMDGLGLDKALVCGASIGGFIAIEMAAAVPARVDGVLIAEAALRSASDWAAQWPRIEGMFALPTQTHEAVAPRFRSMTAGLLARWNIDRNKAGSWRMVDVMWAIREYDAIGQLGAVRASGRPAAVLLGDRGPVIGNRARYEELLPDASVHVLADAGHFPMLDDPEAFVAALENIIRTMDA
jgi:3-oxoadipate enol-lactonase